MRSSPKITQAICRALADLFQQGDASAAIQIISSADAETAALWIEGTTDLLSQTERHSFFFFCRHNGIQP